MIDDGGKLQQIQYNYSLIADESDELDRHAPGYTKYAAGKAKGNKQSVYHPQRWQTVDE